MVVYLRIAAAFLFLVAFLALFRSSSDLRFVEMIVSFAFASILLSLASLVDKADLLLEDKKLEREKEKEKEEKKNLRYARNLGV